ncbi:MAG: hypothetical protein JO263_11595 [Candidatus Eremiobacteraeota bacterium]|nr:hypothetical protein [Candidatus Eremiobacteraeota bacterium]
MLGLPTVCKSAAALGAAVLLTAAIAQPVSRRVASGTIATVAWPYFPGSTIPVRVSGFTMPYHAALLGPGRLGSTGSYEIPDQTRAGSAFLVAGNADGLAAARLSIAKPPDPKRTLLAVASYDNGLIFHDSHDFSVLGVLATGGTPSDTAIDNLGRIAATDTQGSQLTLATLAPWVVAHVNDVLFGDNVAIDFESHDIFVTNRDLNGNGGLTRIAPDGATKRVVTGATAEGLAIDQASRLVYVANTNDGTVAVVEQASMRRVRRFSAIPRVFSLVLSRDGGRLYAISNQSMSSPFGAPGRAIAIDVRDRIPRVVARSASLTFPLGAALDSKGHRLFVTDEALGEVYVLDAQTLRQKSDPLRTCQIPWKPTYDPVAQRLYVPCAGADRVDVFDGQTLKHVAGAPFHTGGYPLAVAIWHSRAG